MNSGTQDNSTGAPTNDQWVSLCRDVKAALLEEAGAETWYLIIATIITVSPKPHLLASFWQYLTTKHLDRADPRPSPSIPASTVNEDDFSTAEAQRRLSQRLGDTLVKQITLIGAPQVLSALIPLAQAQQPQGHAPRAEMALEKWSDLTLPSLHVRGIDTITSIYGTLWPNIFQTFGPYRGDMGFHELAIVYGMYLSDFRHLTPLETEVVAFANITAQGLRGPSLWHVRGLGRVLGARGRDEETAKMRRIKDVIRGVKVSMMAVVEFCGAEMVQRSRLDGGPDGTMGWPNVGDVVRELGGWGDD